MSSTTPSSKKKDLFSGQDGGRLDRIHLDLSSFFERPWLSLRGGKKLSDKNVGRLTEDWGEQNSRCFGREGLPLERRQFL